MANKDPICGNEPSGVLIVRKHAGVTSHDIVNRVRRLYGTRRVGHTGTLDPMATGVLVVLVGRAAKASEYLMNDRKRYRAGLRLGLTTDTEDVTGKVLSTTEAIPSRDAFYAVLPDFLGKIQQIPPMYSAIKIHGQKLVDLARRGQTVERQPREIEIYSLSATNGESPADYWLDVSCSGGTYIRTLCADIGASLGCGGVMTSLERTETGGFGLDSAHSIEELEELPQEERNALLIPIETLFSDLPAILLPPFYARLCRNGCAVALKKIGWDLPLESRARLCREEDGFFALGEVVETEEGAAVRSIKTFLLDEPEA